MRSLFLRVKNKLYRDTLIRLSKSTYVLGGKEQKYIDNDKVFAELSSQYDLNNSYGYSQFDTWKRGAERSIELLKLFPKDSSKLRILEVGCGDGMVSYALKAAGHDVELVDIRDWLDDRARSNVNLTIAEFLTQRFPFEDNQFDLIFSYNAFEHFMDPEHIFNESARVLKPSGKMFFSFSPIYYSAWGLHLYRLVSFPYPQSLFSEDYLNAKLVKEGKIKEGESVNTLQTFNKWRKDDFTSLWKSRSDIVLKEESFFYSFISLRLLFKYRKFLNEPLQDLLTAGTRVLLEKKK